MDRRDVSLAAPTAPGPEPEWAHGERHELVQLEDALGRHREEREHEELREHVEVHHRVAHEPEVRKFLCRSVSAGVGVRRVDPRVRALGPRPCPSPGTP